MNKAATVTYSGSAAHSVSYGYDASGNRTSMTDATGSSTYTWDQFDAMTAATNGAGQTTSYVSNADGQVTTITYPLPPTATWATDNYVTYGYDHADQLTSVTDFNNHQIAITPNADGLPAGMSLGATGDTVSASYDNTDTPSSITLKNSGGTTLQSFTYSDSPAGTITQETDTPSSSQSPAVYTHDAKGRVTSMTPGTGSTLNYGFDASSNLTTLPTGASGSYNDAGEITSSTLSSTTTNYAYDADGQQLTSKQGSTTITSGTWNGAGQLTAWTSPSAAMTVATYDGDGLRATSTTSAGTQDYVWNSTGQLPTLMMDSSCAYIYAGGLAPVEQVSLSGGTITYLVADSLGSVRGTINSTGTLTGTTAYDAWGQPETTGGLTATTPFGFAGAYTDSDGLIYLLARYYSPQAWPVRFSRPYDRADAGSVRLCGR